MQYSNDNFSSTKIGTKTKRILGAGLEDLLGISYVANSNNTESNLQDITIKQILIQHLMPGKFQPRKIFNAAELSELASSIAVHGLLQPIIVREVTQDNYEIISGERRWRAAKIAELKQVPVVVVNISDQKALAFGIIENIQRQDLNPIEEAFSIKRLIDEFELTHAKVSALLGKSRASISNMLRLTNLTQDVQDFLISNKIEIGHAKILLAFESDMQKKLALKVIEKKMSVRSLESFIKNYHNVKTNMQSKLINDDLNDLQIILENKFSAKVILKLNNKGSGNIIINVNSLEDLKNLIKKL